MSPDDKEFQIPFEESRKGRFEQQEEKALGRRLGSYLASRAIDRPSIGSRRGKRGRGGFEVPTGGKPGTRKPTGSRRDVDGDGWADEGTTKPVWVGIDTPQDRKPKQDTPGSKLSSGSQNVRTGNRRANELGLSTEVFDDETGVDEDDPKFFNEDGDFDADAFNEAVFDGEKTSEETTRKLEKEANESYKKLAKEKYPDGKIPERFSEAKIQMDKVFSTTDDRNLPLKAVQKSLVVVRDKDNNIVGAARFKRPTEADDDLYVYHIASYGQEAGAENLGASIFGKILEIANNNNSGITLEATPGSQKYWEDMGFINIDPDKMFSFTENAILRLFPDKVRELNSETRDDSEVTPERDEDLRLSSGMEQLSDLEMFNYGPLKAAKKVKSTKPKGREEEYWIVVTPDTALAFRASDVNQLRQSLLERFNNLGENPFTNKKAPLKLEDIDIRDALRSSINDKNVLTVAKMNTYRAGNDNNLEVFGIATRAANRRQGLATEMFNSFREAFPELNLQHSDALTNDGRAFADATPTSEVTGRFSSGRDIKAKLKVVFYGEQNEYSQVEGFEIDGKEFSISRGGDSPGRNMYNGYLAAYDEKGNLAGYIDYQSEDVGRTATIAMVEVGEDYKRTGVASALLDSLLIGFQGYEISPGYTTEDGAAWWRRATGGDGPIIVDGLSSGAQKTSSLPLKSGREYTDDDSRLSSGKTYQEILESQPELSDDKKQLAKNIIEKLKSETLSTEDQFREITDPFGDVMRVLDDSQERYDFKQSIARDIGNLFKGEIDLDEDIIVLAQNGKRVNLGRKLFITPADNDVSSFLSPTVRMLDDRDLQELRAIEPYETFSIPENGNRTAVKILLRLRPSPEAIEELQKNGTPIGYKSFERDADGNSIDSVSVGYLDRELSFATNEPDSPITVSHDAFFLQKDAQGLGIASQVNARNEKIYEALGVRSILTWGTSGDDSRGATHWPKNGFTWAGRKSKQEFLELIEEGLSDQDNDWFTAEERSRISSLYRMLDLGDGYEYETEASPEELLDFEKAEGLFKKYRGAFYYARTVGASESTAGERLSSAGGRNNPLVIKTDGRYGDTSGKKDFSAEELKTIDDINERLSNSDIDFAWISLENEDGAQTSSPIVNYASRPIVVVRIDDENNVPFYRSTGLGGKDQDLYPAGMWFPFWGYASGANFFVKNEGMHNYYGIPELEEISQQLNKLTSGLPLLKNTDWRNIRSKEDGSMNDDFRELINNTSFVNADRIFDQRSVNHHIDVSKKKLRQVLRSRKQKSTETPSSERLSSGVVGSKSSKDVYDTSVGHNDRRNPSRLLGKSKDGKEYSSIRFNNESYDIKTSKSENGFSVFIENENGQIASLSFSGSIEKELSNLLSYSSSKEAQKSGVLEALFDHVLLEYPDKTLKATSETVRWFNYINNGMADYGVKGFRKYGLSGKYRNGEDVVIDGDYTFQSNLLLKTSPASSFLTPITVNDRTRDIKWNSQIFTIGGESIVFGAPEEAEFGEGIRKLPINPFEILELDPSSKEGREAALKWYSAVHGASISVIDENRDFKPSNYVSALLYAASKGDKAAQKEFDDFVKASDSLLEKIDSNITPVENPEKALSLNSRMVHQTSFKPPVDEEGNLILKPLEDFPVTAEDGSEVTVNRTTLHFAIDHLAEGHMFRTETDNDSYIVITSIDSFIKENPDSLENFNIVDTAASPPPEEGLRFPQGTYRLIEVKKGENARQKVEDALRADGVEILVGGERNSGTPGADEAGRTRAQILGAPPSVASDIKLAFIEQINRTNVLEDMRYADIPSSTSFLERTSKNALLRIANRKQNTWVSSDKEEAGSRLFSGKAPRYPRSPTLGAFLGEAEERFDGVNSWEEFRERYNDAEMVFLDYETTGLDFDEFGKATRNGQPTQIGLVRIKNGKEIGRLNLFMNPEEPLGDWSRKNLKDADGNPLTDEWLAGQIPMSEAHRQVAEFIGDAIIGVQNATFDKNVLEDTLSDNGIDWRPSGYLDTRDISAMTLPVWSEENQDAPFTVDRNGNKQPSSSLAAITEFLGVELGEGHHNADVDAFATSQVMQKIIDGAIENGWSTDVLSKEKRDAKLKADNDKFDADVIAFEESLADYDERLASGIWLPEDFDISIDEVRQISTGRSLSPSPQARDSQRRQIVIIPTSDASTDNRYMVYAQLEIEGGAITQWGGRGKPGKPTGRIIITGDGVDTARGIQNPDGSISPNTPPGPRRYSGLYGRYREAMIASIINLDLEDKVKPKKNAETGLRSDAKRRPFDGFVIEGETLEESTEILNRLGKELLSEIKKPTWKAPKKRTTRKPTPELRARPEPRKERPLLGRREAVRPVDRLSSGRPLIPMRRPIEPEAPKPSIPGKIYKYGEPGPDGRAVRKTNRSWLKGMTSEQIAEVLVPESKEQMLEMWIDDFVGDMRIDNKSREALSQYFDNGYIEYADFNPEHIKEMRKLLSDSLGSNPKMKWAFEEHGAPSFIPMSKQGADLYESNPRIIDTLNKLKEMRGTEQRPYVRGVANPLLDAVYLNPRALIDLESVDRGVDRLERLMSPDRKVNKGDAHIDGSLQAVLTHEWGHWLHYRILRDIERSGISNRKYYGSGDINDDRYLLAWDVGERYNDRGSERPERISLFESGSDFSEEEDVPRLITSYGHVNMREAIAEGMVAVLHPNDEVQNTAINKKLRRDISSLLGIDEGDKPWERTERLSSGATDADTKPAPSGGRMRRLVNRLRGGEQEETPPPSPPQRRSRPRVPSYQSVTKDLKYFQPPLGEVILNTEGTVPDEQTLLDMTMEDLTSIKMAPALKASGVRISSEVKRVIAQNISDSIETTAREFIQLFEGVNADYLGDRGSSAPFFRNAPNFAEVKKILQNLDSGSESLFEYNFETGKVKPGSSSAALAEINRSKIYQDKFISKLEDFSLEELLSPRFIYEQQEEGVGLLDRIYALEVADRIGKDDVQKELITPYLQLVQYLQNTMDKARNSESVLAYRTEDNESYSFIFTNPGENPEKALSSLKSNYFVDRLKMTEEQIKELEERGGIVVINREDIDSEKFKSMLKEALIRRIQKESITTIAFSPEKPLKLTDSLVGIADASTEEGQTLLKNALISDIIQTWAISANNANPVALAIQNIAREMFNLDSAIGWNPGITRKVGDGPDLVSGAIGAVSIDEKTPDMLPHEFDGAPILPEEQKKVIRNILQAMYDATQKYFEEKGITHVPVWRGMRVSDSSMVPKDYEQIASTAIMRPLSSWTFSTAIANQFAFMGAGELIDRLDDDRAVVMKGFVPVSDIFSIPVTGFGCLGEDEAVLLGRPIDLIAVKPATLLGFSGSNEDLDRLNRIQDFIGRLSRTGMSEFKKTHEMLTAQAKFASRTKPASDERLSSGRNDDSRLVDWDSPEEIIDWDAISSAQAAGENTPEFENLDDEEKIEAFIEDLNDAWSQWDPCREMRSAAYELAGIDAPKGDPNLSKIGGFWGAGIKIPDKTPVTSKERARFIMAKMAEAVIDDPRFSGNNTSLYRAVMLDDESEEGFLEAMSPGKTIDIPLLSFVDIGPDADQHFLRKFGTDALIELVDFPASYRTRNYFEPIYDSNSEYETLNEIQGLIDQLELEIESEQIDDVQATQSFIEELQKILNEYQETAKRESAKRAELRSQLEELTEDYSITYRWSGKTIDEDDVDFFNDALSATEDEDAYSESVSYEYISGGRMEVVEVVKDESGLYRRIIRLKQTGVYDPENKGSIIPRSERYSDSPRLASGRKKPTPAKKKSTKAHDEAFEKKYEQKMPEGSGDCFSTAVEQAAILAKKYDDVKIVHGYPLGTGGEALGLRFPHAWVEFTENGVEWVRDYSNGNRVEFPKVLYYSIGNIEEKDANKYSRDEAQKMMIERQHYGPW